MTGDGDLPRILDSNHWVNYTCEEGKPNPLPERCAVFQVQFGNHLRPLFGNGPSGRSPDRKVSLRSPRLKYGRSYKDTVLEVHSFTLTVTKFLLFGKRLRQEEAGFPARVDSTVTAEERLGWDGQKNTNLSGKRMCV